MVNTTLIQGADSVNAPAEPADEAFYCFYTYGTYANGTVTKADHPGKIYVGITPSAAHPEGADVLDVEPGDATNAQAAAFVRAAKPLALNLPGLYTSESNFPALAKALAADGIGRSAYYLFQADWDNVDRVPAGADMAQYADPGSYDKDVAYAYVFKAYNPVAPTNWNYGAPLSLEASGGHTSVRLNWLRNLGGHPLPDHYVVWIYRGTTTNVHTLVESYPRDSVPGDAVTWEGGSLERGVTYTAHLSASGPGNEHLGADVFASAVFTTG